MTRENQPICLHPDNPHYFLFRDRPAILITSGEHYGAVLNADFDYEKYLATLAADGLNNTRTFVGAYCEGPGDFRITANSLAPAPGRFVCPWARSDQPGYANGGNKFDLRRWDDGYFSRLRDFVACAGRHSVVVEINLFCPFYKDEMWKLSPMNAANNINGLGDVAREDVYSPDADSGLLEVQESMTGKVVTELRDSDNVFYEVMNEPYARDVPMEWQHRMVDAIAATETELGTRHLISLNIANRQARVEDPHPAVSVFNFHYAWPPETVALNYGLDRPIGDNETGFKGTGDFCYRREGWAFILAGGALYNHLDYSFAVGCEDGTFDYPETQPGGGTPALRKQLRVLSEFIHSFEFVRMSPDPELVGSLPPGIAAYSLVESGQQYAIYLCRSDDVPTKDPIGVPLHLDLPEGAYRTEWLDTASGRTHQRDRFDWKGGERTLSSPKFSQDIALKLLAV